MFRKYFLPVMAIAGACGALAIAFWSERKEPPMPIPYMPAESPYEDYITGAGIVEASSENISIGTPFSNTVAKVYVVEGDKVKAGDPLFEQDLRSLEAQAETFRNQLKVAEINYENQKVQFAFYEQLTDKRAVSQQSYEQAFYALKEAEAQVEVVKAELNEVETNIKRSIVCSPIDGDVLQVNIHIGEIAPAVPYTTSEMNLILLGRIQPYQMRIDIDEDDAWRYKKGAPATAFVRGNSSIHFPMQFKRIEPYIIPKASFTGDTTERIDTRVLQVLYTFDGKDLPIYAGQILDVYIEAEPRFKDEDEQEEVAASEDEDE